MLRNFEFICTNKNEFVADYFTPSEKIKRRNYKITRGLAVRGSTSGNES
jgi:hypothetical protein